MSLIKNIFFLFIFFFLLKFLVLADEILKIEDITLSYPSYYVKVDVYTPYKTVVLMDSRDYNRNIYVEVLKNIDMKQKIDEMKNDLDVMFENKYKIIKNDITTYNSKKLFIFEYTFVQNDKEYRSLKYFLELRDNYYLGLYCSSLSKNFSDIYSDFIKVFNSVNF